MLDGRDAKPRTHTTRSERYNFNVNQTFDEKAFLELLHLLREKPELREALRQVLLTEEILNLPAQVEQLAQAVREMQVILQQLAETVRELVEVQKRTEQRLDRIEQRFDRLEQRLDSHDQRFDRLEQRQNRTEQRLDEVVSELGELKTTVGWLVGDALERRYRERAPSYFQRFMRRIRVLSVQQLCELLDDAVDSGVISMEERNEVLLADVVAIGRRENEECYLLAEISQSVHKVDVERALQRAQVLERVVQSPVIAVVGGNHITPPIRKVAEQLGVGVVLDGKPQR